ncbi:MAG: hypothetical protein MO852_04345 [Candidatus Devosia euplotis]|nr:hypothetical protein [Candidatus Devosia euplotis]
MALEAIGLQEGAKTGVPADRSSTSFAAMAAQLRRDGALGQHAVAALGEGRCESDTGQIIVMPGQRLMQLVTPGAVAAAFAALDTPLELGPVTLRASTTPALFALSALDDLDLDSSRRTLVIMATDARNSDMAFADAAAREIVDFGHLPVLIRPGQVSFELAGTGPWRIETVGLDGVVGEVLVTGSGQMTLRLRLDNGTPAGPTTYFVIERD